MKCLCYPWTYSTVGSYRFFSLYRQLVCLQPVFCLVVGKLQTELIIHGHTLSTCVCFQFISFFFISCIRWLFVCLLVFISVSYSLFHWRRLWNFQSLPIFNTLSYTSIAVYFTRLNFHAHKARKFLDESALILFFKFEIEKHLVSRHFSSH